MQPYFHYWRKFAASPTTQTAHDVATAAFMLSSSEAEQFDSDVYLCEAVDNHCHNWAFNQHSITAEEFEFSERLDIVRKHCSHYVSKDVR